MNPAQMNIKANRKCWRKIRIGLHSRWETQITIVLVEKFDKSEIFIFKWVLNFFKGVHFATMNLDTSPDFANLKFVFCLHLFPHNKLFATLF